MDNEFDYVVFRQQLLRLTGGHWTIFDVFLHELHKQSSDHDDIEKIIFTMSELEILEIKIDWYPSFANAYKDADITIPRTEEMKLFRIS